MTARNENDFPIRADVKDAVAVAIDTAVAKIDGGYEIVELDYHKEYKRPTLSVYLWKKGGIEIDDLEAVHNAISAALDAFEKDFPEEYTLNVSSPGLDRAIVSEDDFRRNLDEKIEVFFTLDGQKTEAHGTLKAYDAETITIETLGKSPKTQNISRKTTTKVQPYVRF